MGLFTSKKGNQMVISIIIVIALFIIIGQVVNLAQRECSSDKDCSSESYCGSDFQCHEYPSITKYNLIPAAFIIALGIIGAAFILRWKGFDQFSR